MKSTAYIVKTILCIVVFLLFLNYFGNFIGLSFRCLPENTFFIKWLHSYGRAFYTNLSQTAMLVCASRCEGT